MEKCVVCGKPTAKTVRDAIINGDVPLCGTCREKFEKCSVCGEYYHKDDLVDGKCEYCQGEEE